MNNYYSTNPWKCEGDDLRTIYGCAGSVLMAGCSYR